MTNYLNFKKQDLFLFYNPVIEKLAGIYRISRRKKVNKSESLYFIKAVNYRRALDSGDLTFNKIAFKFNRRSVLF